LSQEFLSPGLLYVAASRGKTWGSMSQSNPHPEDSAIYFLPENMCAFRVLHCSTHLDRKKNARVKNENVKKRDNWVAFLEEKAEITRRKVYTDSVLKSIEQDAVLTATTTQFESKGHLIETIADTIFTPHPAWTQSLAPYKISKSFFGLT